MRKPAWSLSPWRVSESEQICGRRPLQKFGRWNPTPVGKSGPPVHQGQVYPGRLVDAQVTGGRLAIRLLLFQWDPIRREILSIRRARVKLFTWAEPARAIRDWKWSQADSLIVTTRALKTGAEALRDFQQLHHGVKAAILYVEDLSTRDVEIGDKDLPEGYATDRSADRLIQAYDAATGENTTL